MRDADRDLDLGHRRRLGLVAFHLSAKRKRVVKRLSGRVRRTVRDTAGGGLSSTEFRVISAARSLQSVLGEMLC
jgi:hypothetical protein